VHQRSPISRILGGYITLKFGEKPFVYNKPQKRRSCNPIAGLDLVIIDRRWILGYADLIVFG
jgi:hypothetical protein